MRLFSGATARGANFEDAVKQALKVVLVSPHFLFRIENQQKSAAPYLVNDWELASRLSYFLWSSMPDGELLNLAAKKKLRDPKILEAQVRRLIASPKFESFAQSFAGQWLHVRELYGVVQPDPNKFPNFTPTLRDAMFAEVTQFFGSVAREDANLLQLLDADYSFVNEELAKHYGIEGVSGAELRRVNVEKGRRGGLLTTAAVLTVTSRSEEHTSELQSR